MDSDKFMGVQEADDSGLFTCSSDVDATNHITQWKQSTIEDRQQESRESIFFMTEEIRKSSSEIDHLSKFKNWYEQELQSQKNNRLESLERLYVQERKYILENQRQEQELQRLKAKCVALEMNTPSSAMSTLPASRPEKQISIQSSLDSFEAQQQQAKLLDQKLLIEVLRKQKKQLLADMERLSLDHDSKLIHLQRQLAGFELENKHITHQCKQLIDEQRALAYKLELKATTLRSVTAEREQLRQVLVQLNETLQTQEHLLALKEREFLDMKQHYERKLNSECSIDAMHNYSLAFHEAILAKTSEITSLKHSLFELQSEVLVMSKMQVRYEEQQRQLEEMNFQLEAQILKQALKDAQLKDLTTEKEMITSQLMESQQLLQNAKQELLELHNQYLQTNVKYENSQHDLEELQLQNDEKINQLSQLKQQMQLYLQKCNQLSDAKAEMGRKLEDREEKHFIDASTQTINEAPALEQRIETLEQQLNAISKQKGNIVALLQKLLQLQNKKLKNTSEMEADWRQLLNALQATQQMEMQMEQQLQQKTNELQQLNELFAQQNEQLQQLQLLNRAHETQSNNELQQLKQAHATDAANLKQLQRQIESLLKERECSTKKQYINLFQMLEVETGRKLRHVKSWPELIKLLVQQLRAVKGAADVPLLKMKLRKIGAKYEKALTKIDFLEKTLVKENTTFQVADSSKSSVSFMPLEPAHEVANLIDDYKKLIQQTAQETGRPRNRYILELIEHSRRSQPSLCQLSEGVVACRNDVRDLKELLVSLESRSTRQDIMPSLMDELLAVTEKV